MPYVADLLGRGSPIPFALLAGPAAETELTSVAAVESLRSLEHVPPGALAVVTGRSTARAAGYQVDVAIRTAAERGVPALLLIGVADLPRTAAHLATRAGIAVLSVPEDVDVAKVVLQLGQVIRGDAADTLARADAALDALRTPGESPTELLARVSEALGCPLTLTDEPDQGEPVWVAGRCRGSVAGPKDDAVRLVLPAVAAAVSLQRTHALERETAPGAARSEVVAELILSERAQAGQLAERARMLGFPVDEVHTVVRVRTGAATGVTAGTSDGGGTAHADLAEDRRLAETFALLVHQTRHPTHERWNAARLADDLLLIATGRAEVPGTGSGRLSPRCGPHSPSNIPPQTCTSESAPRTAASTACGSPRSKRGPRRTWPHASTSPFTPSTPQGSAASWPPCRVRHSPAARSTTCSPPSTSWARTKPSRPSPPSAPTSTPGAPSRPQPPGSACIPTPSATESAASPPGSAPTWTTPTPPSPFNSPAESACRTDS